MGVTSGNCTSTRDRHRQAGNTATSQAARYSSTRPPGPAAQPPRPAHTQFSSLQTMRSRSRTSAAAPEVAEDPARRRTGGGACVAGTIPAQTAAYILTVTVAAGGTTGASGGTGGGGFNREAMQGRLQRQAGGGGGGSSALQVGSTTLVVAAGGGGGCGNDEGGRKRGSGGTSSRARALRERLGRRRRDRKRCGRCPRGPEVARNGGGGGAGASKGQWRGAGNNGTKLRAGEVPEAISSRARGSAPTSLTYSANGTSGQGERRGRFRVTIVIPRPVLPTSSWLGGRRAARRASLDGLRRSVRARNGEGNGEGRERRSRRDRGAVRHDRGPVGCVGGRRGCRAAAP